MKSLFDKNDDYTNQAKVLATLTKSAIKDIVNAFLRDGYSYRDIRSIMTDVIRCEIMIQNTTSQCEKSV